MKYLKFTKENAAEANRFIGLKLARFGNTEKWFNNGPYTCPLLILYKIDQAIDKPFFDEPVRNRPPEIESFKYLVIESNE